MRVPPAARLGRSVLDLVALPSRLWTQLLLAPSTVLSPPAVSAGTTLGPGRCTFYTCDLSTEYVHLNADYTT